MTNFILMVKNILEEQGKNIDDLFKDNIISKNTFYKYSENVLQHHQDESF